MFGPFSPGDSVRVYRLQRRGLSLDLERGLTQPHMPLWEAWLAFVTQQAMGCATYVWRDPRTGEAIVQLRYRPHQAAADVVYLAPALPDDSRPPSGWLRLLDRIAVEMGGRGIQRLFANLPESRPEGDVFHQSGFAPYAQEDVYCLAHSPAGPPKDLPPGLRPQRPEDWPALQKLCLAITPQRIRQIEGGVAGGLGGSKQQSFVVPNGSDDLRAALYLHSGGVAHWIRVLLRPDMCHLADDLVAWAVSTLAGQPPRPVFCSVRQYEIGVREALQSNGFEPHHTRTSMVKQTFASIKVPGQEMVPALMGGAEPAPPGLRINHERTQQPGMGSSSSAISSQQAGSD